MNMCETMEGSKFNHDEAREMLAYFRGYNIQQISDRDPGISVLVYNTFDELKKRLSYLHISLCEVLWEGPLENRQYRTNTRKYHGGSNGGGVDA
eukprot:UN19046